MEVAKKWYGNRVIGVVILAIFSACSLLVIQGIWLKRTFENETHQLNRNLNRALPEFLFFKPDLNLLAGLNENTSTGHKLEELKEQIRHSVFTSLQSNNISTHFAYALLKTSSDSILLSSDSRYNEALRLSDYRKCINCTEVKHLPVDSLENQGVDYVISISQDEEAPDSGLTPEDRVYISLYFPDFDQVIFNNILKQLILVVVFVLIIVLCFFYILRIVFKQKKVSEIKDDFINSLTHEFKTPLASMSLATTVLRESLVDHLNDRDKHHFELIRNEQISLENQIDKVLQMAMADAGNFELELEIVELHDLIEETLNSLDLIIAQKKGRVDFRSSEAKILLRADKTHISNVIYNLIDNALKYSQKTPEIIIKTAVDNSLLTLSIEDNGIGMSADAKKAIFDKFYRAKNQAVHESQGFGLGLSYVKRIVNLHGGGISLKSEPGKGSVFILSLPIQKSHV